MKNEKDNKEVAVSASSSIDLLSVFPGTATLIYKLDDVTHILDVQCLIGQDDENTMREHLREWLPSAEFQSVTFTQDR